MEIKAKIEDLMEVNKMQGDAAKRSCLKGPAPKMN